MFVRKGLRFDDQKFEQMNAILLLNVAGHGQTEFVSFLVNDFIRRNKIDVKTITGDVLKAAVINQRRLWDVPETEVVKNIISIPTETIQSKPSVGTDNTDEDDGIDMDMMKMLDAFK